MKISISRESSTPAYMQIYYHFRKSIEDGAFEYGHKLPSKRILAEEIGMSVVPVEHAYALLCDEGYIESRQRSGYIVIYKESDFLHHMAEPEPRVSLHMNAGETHNILPFSTLSKTMRRVLSDYGEHIFNKADNKGCLILRQAISKYLGRAAGIHVNSEQIIIGAGAEYLYGLVAQLFGEKVFALETPSYDKIRKVYEAHGIRYEMLKMGSRGIQTKELQQSKAEILHITPFNSYPSGVTADVSKRIEYLKWAEERDGVLIEDNYESELTVSKKNEETIFALSEKGRVIYLNTFSQTISPALRVGYMILPMNMLDLFEEKLGFCSCAVPVFEQYVLTELIESGDFERHINRVRRLKRKELIAGKAK